MENFNLNIQQQITSKTVLQIAYVGSQGHNLWRFFDISQPSEAAINSADLACNCINDYSGTARPFNNNPYDSFYVLQENDSGQSNYNSLQTSFRVNGWHGITSIVNYVWSRSMDNSSDSDDFEPNAAQPNDSTRPQLEYAPSNFNVPNRFTWIFAYDLPDYGWELQAVEERLGHEQLGDAAERAAIPVQLQFRGRFQRKRQRLGPSGRGRAHRVPSEHIR